MGRSTNASLLGTPLQVCSRATFTLSTTASHYHLPSSYHHLIQKFSAFFSWAFSGYIYHWVHPAAFQQGSHGRTWQMTKIPWILCGHQGATQPTLRILTETWQNGPNSLQKDKGCLQSCLLCSPPELTEFPAYRRFLILVLKHMTLSVVLLKFILFLLLLPRSNKAFPTISWSFPVSAMPSSVESSGHFLTAYCYLRQGLRLMLAQTNPMADHGGVLQLIFCLIGDLAAAIFPDWLLSPCLLQFLCLSWSPPV